ncbi:MAG: energy transducer TonB [bacterium]
MQFSRLLIGTAAALFLVAAAPATDFDTAPTPEKADFPAYPEEANGASGEVVMSVLIDEMGVPGTFTVIEETADHPEFTRAVAAVLPEWRFDPARKDGVPVPCSIVIPFRFEPETAPAATPEEAQDS